MSGGAGSFKDHFSGHADAYAAARPTYPDALFAALVELADPCEHAWDCATGNGQAARALAGVATRVTATDASATQISSATGPANVEYRVARSEDSGLDDASIDLVTVAQALHWFDIDAFFAEAGRVLRPGGILAYWSYGNCDIGGGCGDIVAEVYRSLDEYWPPERMLIERGYRDISPPFPVVSLPPFEMRIEWTSQQLIDYVYTWSACQRARRATGDDPFAPYLSRLRERWGDGRRWVSWPLYVTACRRPN